MIGTIAHMFIGALLLVGVMCFTAGCSASVGWVETEELDLVLIEEIDERKGRLNYAVNLGLLEPPDQDWIDRSTAYYYAMHIAWAYKDREDYVHFYEEMRTLYAEMEDELMDNAPDFLPAPNEPSDHELERQAL